ncbi:MAG: aminotransferase class III-fold pyridoxal phosphate-dependent enzyme [Caulobacteraceae bacterium]|nr:aminotransferase class III-fold pyridoxal phosphate-dependent enzyme [Caulobacteraceae bacterium]
MPFTPNRRFKASPRLFVGAEGMRYETEDGRQVLDAIAGLWCVNAGHGQRPIVEAIKAQAERLDFVSSFQMSHPAAFELADRLAAMTPGDLNHVFFSNSGSEAVDTALKIARAYHVARGEGGRRKFISRLKGYHGVGWGGVSVSGIGRHRRDFGPALEVDHLALPYDAARSAFSRGQPEAGADYADELSALFQLHDPSTVAAVIVEAVTGSGGVYPPPKGYLERLRAICDAHGVLLIFDEVITGFGRLGEPFAGQALGVVPDLMTCAKGMTNGAVPMGATFAGEKVFDAFMAAPESQIELPHGYTYSAHPLACAAGLATLDVYRDQDIFARAAAIAGAWEDRIHALRASPHVVDIRNIGLLAAIDLAPRPGEPGARGAACGQAAFDAGVLIRTSGDTIMLSPPLILSQADIDQITGTIASALDGVV